MIQAPVKASFSASSPTSNGPMTAPAKRPVIITPTAQAGAFGIRWTTASVKAPGHAQPTPPASSAAITITYGRASTDHPIAGDWDGAFILRSFLGGVGL